MGEIPQAWYTIEQAQEILQLAYSTVAQLCREGKLPAFKAGKEWRISRAGLEEMGQYGTVHRRLVEEIAERAAVLTAERVLAMLAGGLQREVTHQSFESARERAARPGVGAGRP